MIATISDLQRFLVSKGAKIDIDGRGGPATRAAILSVFSNRIAPAVAPADLITIANRLGGSLAQVRAVARVESAGGAFNDAGQPKALYERHYAWRRLRIKIPFLSDPAPGGYTMDADRDGINDSWEKIADMACRNPVVAFESASFGKFQVMGAHWKTLGYAGPVEMVYSLVESEYAHYEMLARFIERNGLIGKFRALSRDWRANTPFARAYNGPAQKGYDRKLADAMANP
jgi:N-acetylmuramidase